MQFFVRLWSPSGGRLWSAQLILARRMRPRTARRCRGTTASSRSRRRPPERAGGIPVSYTHLTLPTICSV
eukprot:8435468-Alexandrium_andersonii.AAC.1